MPRSTATRRGSTQEVSEGTVELAWTGLVIGALFGATAGLIESGLVAIEIRRTQEFGALFGYAVLIDAAVFGGMSAALCGLAAGVARFMGRPVQTRSAVRVLAAAGWLVVGLLTFLRWNQLLSEDGGTRPPGIAQTQALAFAMFLGLAAFSWFLASRFVDTLARARTLTRRVAPVLVVATVAAAGIAVVADLGGRYEAAAPPPAPVPTRPVVLPLELPNLAEQPSEPAAGAVPTPGTGPRATTTTPLPPNVLLITIDSLRADHLGSYGYGAARTPNLDRLAAEGVRFSRAYTARNGTTPAHASIFTGAYTSTHGVWWHMVDVLRPGVPTLAETLGTRGYTTAGMFSWLAFQPAYSGLDRGFQVYADFTINLPSYLADRRTSTLAATYKRLKSFLFVFKTVDEQAALSRDVEGNLDGKADVTTAGVADWLETQANDGAFAKQPFFLWVHYWDPHWPYSPPPEFDRVPPQNCGECLDGSLETVRRIADGWRPQPGQLDRLIGYYDGEIAFADAEIGRLLDTLTGLGLEQNTLVIVMGDHGESLGEDDRWFHGGELTPPEIHVPLIMRLPGRLPAGTTVDQVARSIDIMPTILEVAGAPTPSTVEGRSLLPLVAGSEAADSRFAVAEVSDRSLVSLVTRDWVLERSNVDGSVRLLRNLDGAMTTEDVAGANPEVAARLEALLRDWQATHP